MIRLFTPPTAVRKELDEAERATRNTTRDWNTAPLQELIDHVVNTHHAYVNRELPARSARLAKVYRVYNQRYGETLGEDLQAGIGGFGSTTPEALRDLAANLKREGCWPLQGSLYVVRPHPAPPKGE